MITAILLDLDDTLILEEDAVAAALLSTVERFAASHEVEPTRLVASIRRRATELWTRAPAAEYCHSIGISWWEGISGDLGGDDPNLKALREWVPAYRTQAWSLALADHPTMFCSSGSSLIAWVVGAAISSRSLAMETSTRRPRSP